MPWQPVIKGKWLINVINHAKNLLTITKEILFSINFDEQ
jgi:hypothetical protein